MEMTESSTNSILNPSSSSSSKRLDITLKLPQLQNLCKRDPSAYKSDYESQVRRLRSEITVLQLNSSSSSSDTGSQSSSSCSRLVELIQFTAAVSSSSYRGIESDAIANLLIQLLLGGDSSEETSSSSSSTAINLSLSNGAVHIHRDIRKACVSALILMRNKGAIPPLRLLQLFFRLMSSVPDKNLRESLHRHIVNDIRNVNNKKNGRTTDDALNRSVQAYIHRIISNNNTTSTTFFHDDSNSSSNPNEIAAKRGTDIVCELYRKSVWTDARTVSILTSAVTCPIGMVMTRAMRFFLNIEEKMDEDIKRQQNDEWIGLNDIDFHKHSKKTQARKRQVAKQIRNRIKHQRKREQDDIYITSSSSSHQTIETSKKLYPAIELIHDPQGLAEKVFQTLRHNSSKFKFEVKLLILNFLTRLIGNHELLLLPLYPYLQRYLSGGHQKDVSAILAYSVQACHSYVPPEEIYGLLQTISHNFITERCSGEQMAVGINAVRAICSRVPSVLLADNDDEDEEDGQTTSISLSSSMDIRAYVQDLVGYKKHRDRSVCIAARSWCNFIREVHPSLLRGRDRGSIGSALYRNKEEEEGYHRHRRRHCSHRPLRYGEMKVAMGVEGADLLAQYEAQKEEKRQKKKRKRRENGDNDDDDDESDDDDDDDDDEDDGIREERMNDEVDDSDDESGEWVDVQSDDDDDDDKEKGTENKDTGIESDDDNDNEEDNDEEDDEEEDEKGKDANKEMQDDDDNIETTNKETTNNNDDDDNAPDLILVKEEVNGKMIPQNNDDTNNKVNIKSSSNEKNNNKKKILTSKERDQMLQTLSSTRIFSNQDFEQMKKLVHQEEQNRRNPRAAAKYKRKNMGHDFSNSDNSEEEDEEDSIRIVGAMKPLDLMADAKKKRMNKAERLEKIISGRQQFESKQREGGSTNTEKKRKKHFVMTKFSGNTRQKMSQKSTSRGKKRNKGGGGSSHQQRQSKADRKKRRRKF